ncbi:hypothetical protein ES703_74013 [subsurface metagenome]
MPGERARQMRRLSKGRALRSGVPGGRRGRLRSRPRRLGPPGPPPLRARPLQKAFGVPARPAWPLLLPGIWRAHGPGLVIAWRGCWLGACAWLLKALGAASPDPNPEAPECKEL